MLSRRDAAWDLAIYDRDNQLILVVEVKNKINALADWAAQLRRNILAHGIFPKAPYFLMVFPDRFYLWSNVAAQLDQSEPTYTIDACSILQPYFEQAGVSANQINPQSLELIVASWLSEVIHSEKLPEQIDSSEQWLIESGLYPAIAGGHFDHEAVA
ncbi:MAG: hypothetical protein KME32_03125 [Mojavia pulchra JT2-VF2]|jgi:hypothetical protein|uniref:Uncharacterized protein n=1 Tax=Mojavia pulchra JT2-VF2 TaxID=287848 RepID=A0A951PTW6_9NOST|nr:hypothetical protein [Mojavia pulchra JT2-VF2]